jgi:hypothetical protein
MAVHPRLAQSKVAYRLVCAALDRAPAKRTTVYAARPGLPLSILGWQPAFRTQEVRDKMRRLVARHQEDCTAESVVAIAIWAQRTGDKQLRDTAISTLKRVASGSQDTTIGSDVVELAARLGLEEPALAQELLGLAGEYHRSEWFDAAVRVAGNGEGRRRAAFEGLRVVSMQSSAFATERAMRIAGALHAAGDIDANSFEAVQRQLGVTAGRRRFVDTMIVVLTFPLWFSWIVYVGALTAGFKELVLEPLPRFAAWRRVRRVMRS